MKLGKVPLRFRKAVRVWCDGKTKEFLKSPCFFSYLNGSLNFLTQKML